MTRAASTEGAVRKARIYRKAALAVERAGEDPLFSNDACAYGYACNAIETVQGRDFLRVDSAATAAFKDVFSPGWATAHGFFGPMEPMKNRNHRVIALCFMAAMVEAGDA